MARVQTFSHTSFCAVCSRVLCITCGQLDDGGGWIASGWVTSALGRNILARHRVNASGVLHDGGMFDSGVPCPLSAWQCGFDHNPDVKLLIPCSGVFVVLWSLVHALRAGAPPP